MNKFKQTTGLLWIIGCFFFSMSVQSKVLADKDSLPIDKSIRYGQLANGFTYYIKPIDKPQKKLYMQFFVKAGIFHENPSQIDMAHALEHLAFKGGKNFPNHILNDSGLFNRLGMNKNDIDARTGVTSTRYYFNPSTAHYERGVNTGFLFFHDIAADLRLGKEDVDNERGPLRQEKTFREGAGLEDYFVYSKLMSKIFPCQNDQSDFFKHNRNFSRETLLQFYRTFYRPDRMALFVVGNVVDMDQLEGKIKHTFSDLENPSDSIKEIDCYGAYFSRPNQFIMLENKTNRPSPVVDNRVTSELFFRDQEAEEKVNTWEGLERGYLWKFLTETLNKRFRENGRSYESSGKVYSDYSSISRPPSLRIKILSTNNNEEQVFKEAIQTMNQIKKYGLTASEWKNITEKYLLDLEKADPEDPEYWLQEIADHYVYNEALPDKKLSRIKKWLSNLSLEDINSEVEGLVADMPEDIGVIAPVGHKILDSNEKMVRDWIREANELVPKEYHTLGTPPALLKKDELLSLKVRGYRDMGITASGAKEIVLQNGARVIMKSFKPTEGNKQNKIILHGFSPRGASCFPKEDYFSAINAPHIIKNSGVGDLDRFDLTRFLENSSLWQGVFPYINYYETGIKGNAEKKDVEKMFQLVYLFFSKPRKDIAAFEHWKNTEAVSFLDPNNNLIIADFSNNINEVLRDSSNLPRGTKRIIGLERTDIKRVHEIYRKLYGIPEDFTFVITGDFSMDTVVPMVQKYLGNLSKQQTSSSFSCNYSENAKNRLPTGPLFTNLKVPNSYSMESTEYSMRFIGNTENPGDWKEHIKAEFLGFYLSAKLKDLRFKDGAALYKMFAGTVYQDELSRYLFYISLDVIPEELEWLRQKCMDIVTQIKTESLDKEIFEEILKNVLLRKYGSQGLNQNDRMAERLYKTCRYGAPWIKPSEFDEFVHSLTTKDVQEIAKKYLKKENMFEFAMGNAEVK